MSAAVSDILHYAVWHKILAVKLVTWLQMFIGLNLFEGKTSQREHKIQNSIYALGKKHLSYLSIDLFSECGQIIHGFVWLFSPITPELFTILKYYGVGIISERK